MTTQAKRRPGTAPVIVFASSKGGVGKTTLCTALAVCAFSTLGKAWRVAMIDADPQKSLANWVDRRGHDKDGPDLLDVDSTSEAIELIRGENFAFVLVDTPPGNISLIEQAIASATIVIIPARAGALDLTAIGPVLELCSTYGKPHAFVVNASDPKWRLTKSSVEYLRKLAPVLAPVIPNRLSYAAAPTLGKTGPEIDKDGQAREEIAALWQSVLHMLETVPA